MLHSNCDLLHPTNKIIISKMSFNEFLLKPSRFPRKQLSQLGNLAEPQQLLLPERHRLSEPRTKMNLIKINKSKLPQDFFPKKEASSSRRPSQNRDYLPLQFTEPLRLPKKAESQRQHYSPEKTSFFGLNDELDSQNSLMIGGGSKFLSRKFETREQSKRQLYPLEPTRKLNTAAKIQKNELLELFPQTYDNHLNQLLASSTRGHCLRVPLKRDMSNKQRQPLILDDPEAYGYFNEERQPVFFSKSGANGGSQKNSTTNANNVSVSENAQQPLNITFYNAKSSCFPPINKAG